MAEHSRSESCGIRQGIHGTRGAMSTGRSVDMFLDADQ